MCFCPRLGEFGSALFTSATLLLDKVVLSEAAALVERVMSIVVTLSYRNILLLLFYLCADCVKRDNANKIKDYRPGTRPGFQCVLNSSLVVLM